MRHGAAPAIVFAHVCLIMCTFPEHSAGDKQKHIFDVSHVYMTIHCPHQRPCIHEFIGFVDIVLKSTMIPCLFRVERVSRTGVSTLTFAGDRRTRREAQKKRALA